MKKVFFIGLVLLTILTSCATILSGTKAKVTVSTNTGETVNVKVDGRTYNDISGPTKIKVKRTFTPSVIEAENANSTGSVVVDKRFNPVTLGNIILGGLPGFIVDAIDGSMARPVMKSYIIYMQAKNDQIKIEEVKKEEPKKEEPKKPVNSIAETKIEQSTIQWDIKSRPQDAEIFWRVESKTPEVKNSYNKYISVTPYEASKQLNIKGLTPYNAENVSIIIRCEKEGYLPQEQEFNVSTVMEQEEISAFFRLVKEE